MPKLKTIYHKDEPETPVEIRTPYANEALRNHPKEWSDKPWATKKGKAAKEAGDTPEGSAGNDTAQGGELGI